MGSTSWSRSFCDRRAVGDALPIVPEIDTDSAALAAALLSYESSLLDVRTGGAVDVCDSLWRVAGRAGRLPCWNVRRGSEPRSEATYAHAPCAPCMLRAPEHPCLLERSDARALDAWTLGSCLDGLVIAMNECSRPPPVYLVTSVRVHVQRPPSLTACALACSRSCSQSVDCERAGSPWTQCTIQCSAVAYSARCSQNRAAFCHARMS